MIKLSNLSKSFGHRLLFQEVGFSVNKKEKIGIIGRNGYGKSTLLNMISGDQQPEEGEIIIPKDYRIAELSQHIRFTENTVLEEAKKGLRKEQKDEVWKAEMILSGLGFPKEDFQRPPHEFSGGYQIRINLAKALLSEPDMLLLDEPTNYLDIVSLRWMERFLQKWNGEFLLVTHDRAFMDAVVSHVAIIHRQRIKKIKGKTKDAYNQIRQEEEVYEKTRLGMEKKKAKSENFIRKFRSGARSAGLVQSRIKMLDKLEPKEKLEKIPEIRFSFRSISIHSGQMIGIHSLRFGYNASKPPLIKNLELTVSPGDRIGIVGRNGAGKSTLLKLLHGEIKPDSGTIKEKADLKVGYFGQTNVLSLSPHKTILEELYDTKDSPSETEIRSLCGSLLFTGEDVHKPIEVLSGGEKSRVSMGKLLLSPHHVLLLDEPTNHLDMESTDALCSALNRFDGAIIIISHNEDILRRITNKLVVFDNAEVRPYELPYGVFLDEIGWKSEEEDNEIKRAFLKQKNDEPKNNRKEIKRRLRQIERNIQKCEQTIENAESENEKNTTELQKASEENDHVRIRQLGEKASELVDTINKNYEKLEKLLGEKEKREEEL